MNPYTILGLLVAWAISVVGAAMYWGGVQADLAKAVCTAEKNKQLSKANEEIDALNRAARATENAHNDRLADIGKHAVEENQRAEKNRIIAVSNARALVLRNQPACPVGGASSTPEAPATSSGSDGQARCELPATAVRDMEVLVIDADRDVRQLGLCQEVVLSDRKGTP